MHVKDIRIATFAPTGQATLVVMNYDDLVTVIRPGRVQQYLDRVRPPELDLDLTVEFEEAELDLSVGEHPLPKNRRATGWADWRMFTRKGPGNSWKIHRQMKFWSGVNRMSVRRQPLIQREVR